MHEPTSILAGETGPAPDPAPARAINLEGRMRLAMNRLVAAADPDKIGDTHLSYVVTDKKAYFYASVDTTFRYSGHDYNLDAAVDKAISKFNAAMIQKAAEAARLAEDSETDDTTTPAPAARAID